MADLRIVDAPVLLQESITDDVKMPTGGLGNFSIRLGDIVWYVVQKEQLANKNYVDLSSKGVKDSLDEHIADKNNPHQVTKGQVGLGNVDNTADIDKPVSDATKSAIITATTDMATKAYVNSKDGDLTTLTTTDKTNLVKAINEVVSVKANKEDVASSINNLINNKADKATTLEGYGITDAYTKSEIDADYSGVKTLYDKNVEAGAGENVWDANLVAYGETTQKQINDGLESIAQLADIQNPRDGMRVYVKSYHVGLNKGGGTFIYDATKSNINDNVSVINGWVRQDWTTASVFDVGIKGDETNHDALFQNIVDAAADKKIVINLEGLTIKLTKLDIPSNFTIRNGAIDTTSSTEQNTYGRAALMFKTTPREALDVDYEQQAKYAAVEVTTNIIFQKIKFISKNRIAYFYKFENLLFLECEGVWDERSLFKLIGGWAGTQLVNDTPSSYNLIDPINGRNKNIIIDKCKFKGDYKTGIYSSPFHFVACENVLIENSTTDSTLGWHIDIYNKGFKVINSDVINTNLQAIADVVANVGEKDLLAIYIGQNSYDVQIQGGKWRNFGNKGLYIEGASQITVNDIDVLVEGTNNTTLIDVQSNHRDNANIYWINCADITIKNIKSHGTKYGIVTSTYQSKRAIKNLNIIGNNDIQVQDGSQALILAGVDTYFVTGIQAKGSLFLGSNNVNGRVNKSRFKNASNYALYIDNQNSAEIPKIEDTDFIVDSGHVIYNNGGSSVTGRISYGFIRSYSDSSIIQNGANPSYLYVHDYDYGQEPQFLYNKTLTLAQNAKTSFYLEYVLCRVGWSALVTLKNADVLMGEDVDLSIRASCVNGSIYVTLENKGVALTAKSLDFIVKLIPFASNTFVN